MSDYEELVNKLNTLKQLYGPTFNLCKSPETTNDPVVNINVNMKQTNHYQVNNVSNSTMSNNSPMMNGMNGFKGTMYRCISNPLIRQVSNLSIASESGGAHFVPFGRGHAEVGASVAQQTTTTNIIPNKPRSITTESPITPSPVSTVNFEQKRPLRAISKPYFPHLQPREDPTPQLPMQQQQQQQPTAHNNFTPIRNSTMLVSVPNVTPSSGSASIAPSMPNLASVSMLQSIPNTTMMQTVQSVSPLQSVPNSVSSYNIQQNVQQNIMIPQLTSIQIQPALYGMQPNLYGIYNVMQPQQQQQRAARMQQKVVVDNDDDDNKNNNNNGVQCPPVSMLSVHGVRFHGQLYTVDVDEQSIALKNVTCIGTEGRKVGRRAQAPSDIMYEFVVFRATDISQLWCDKLPNYQSKNKQFREGIFFGWPVGT